MTEKGAVPRARQNKSVPTDKNVAAISADTLSTNAKSHTVTSPLRDTIELLLCVAAIYGCYLAYGILHEKITRHAYVIPGTDKTEKFKHSFFLTTAQCVGSMIWAFLLILLEARRRTTVNPEHSHTTFASRVYHLIFDNVPKHKYAIVAASYSVAMLSSTSALSYVSYPIQALAKSSKLIPVMIGRILGGAKYSIREYTHVLAITGGIILFFLSEERKVSSVAPTNSIIGIFLLILSLTMDAVTGPTQEHISSMYKPAVMSMTFWINFFPAVVMFSYIFVSGEYAASMEFFNRHPEIVPELTLYCVLSAIGQSIIVWALFRFNSMTVTVITTTRKFCSILASVIWFANPLALWQWVGVICVFIGIGADSQYKYSQKKEKHKQAIAADAHHKKK